MKRKLGVNVDCLQGHRSNLETLELAYKQGFRAFFTGAQKLETIAALKKRISEL